MTQLAQTMNISVTIINWLIFLPYWIYETEKLKEWSSNENIYRLLVNTFEHSVPLVISTINLVFLTDSIIYMTDFWVILATYFAYFMVAFIWTTLSG